ncbi:MAG: hypothetical protein K6C05_04590 [Anaerovibrio sp.]|uniref:hypothetical protein n=1 Tax=Anaerovibrio sp. TaxID=1872532 RepID=UPI0025E9A17F|nr:hypothetical protein [Anaerovibrio sp.]MCR5176107.1 hypothetical protein [Anaerovibrio sp.]
MNVLNNVSRSAFDYVNSQMKVSKTNGTGTSAGSSADNTVSDTTEISVAARELQQKNADNETMDWLNISKITDGKYKVNFTDTAMIARVIKQGYMMIDGQRVTLDKSQLKQLQNAGFNMKKKNEAVSNQMAMEHNLAASRQNADAWQKQAQMQARAMNTATRIMHGRKVSMEDEKELAEAFPDLYSLAKSAAALEKIKEDQEDRKISEENAKQRAEENAPKDYSFPERGDYPTYETDVSVEMVDGELQIGNVSEVTIPAVN